MHIDDVCRPVADGDLAKDVFREDGGETAPFRSDQSANKALNTMVKWGLLEKQAHGQRVLFALTWTGRRVCNVFRRGEDGTHRPRQHLPKPTQSPPEAGWTDTRVEEATGLDQKGLKQASAIRRRPAETVPA